MLPWSKCSEQNAFAEQTTGRTESGPTKKCSKQRRWECPSCSPNSKLEALRPHSGAAHDWTEKTKTPKLPPIPKVVWQQPPESCRDQYNLNTTNIDSTIRHTQETSKTTVSKSNIAIQGNSTTELRCCYGTISTKSNRERTNTVP